MTPEEAYSKILELNKLDLGELRDTNWRSLGDFIKSGGEAAYYRKEIDELKKIIFTDAMQTAVFAANCYERVKDAEEIIKTNPRAISHYIWNISNHFDKRWEEAEPALLKGSPRDIFNYYLAFERLSSFKNLFPENKWVEAEPILAKKMSIFSQYVIKTGQPNKLYEEKILNDPDCKYNPKYIYDYCSKILKNRWAEAEPIILKHPDYAAKYCTKFKLPVPEEVRNQIIAEVALTNKSSTFRKRFLEDESKRKKRMVEYLKELVSMNKISKETTVEELINNI